MGLRNLRLLEYGIGSDHTYSSLNQTLLDALPQQQLPACKMKVLKVLLVLLSAKVLLSVKVCLCLKAFR